MYGPNFISEHDSAKRPQPLAWKDGFGFLFLLEPDLHELVVIDFLILVLAPIDQQVGNLVCSHPQLRLRFHGAQDLVFSQETALVNVQLLEDAVHDGGSRLHAEHPQELLVVHMVIPGDEAERSSPSVTTNVTMKHVKKGMGALAGLLASTEDVHKMYAI